MQLTVTCPPGASQWLEKELCELGLEAKAASPAVVELPLSQKAALTVCLHSRIAERVLWPLAVAQCSPAVAPEVIAEQVNLRELAKPGTNIYCAVEHDKHVAGDSRITRKHILNNLGVGYRSAHPVAGYRVVSSEQGALCLRFRVEAERCLAYLDVSGEPLHKRGYRKQQREAPLRENIAALMLLMAGWRGCSGQYLVDPFCGSGTVLIEAAMIAAGIAPGSLRSSFGFHYWSEFKPDVWQALCDSGVSPNTPADVCIKGFDADRRAVTSALDNASRAGVGGWIHVEKRQLSEIRPRDIGIKRHESAMPAHYHVITNPPWGERLETKDVAYWLHIALADRVRHLMPNATITLIGPEVRFLDALAMSVTEHQRVRNGGLKCFIRTGQAPQAIASPDPLYPAEQAFELDDEAAPLANRLRKNARKLKNWLRDSGVSAYRIYDRDLPEFNVAVDVYGDRILVQEYEAPDTVDDKKARHRLSLALTAVRAVFGAHREQVFLRKRRQQKGNSQYDRLQKGSATLLDAFPVVEGRVKLLVNLKDYLDTGLFLDHRPMRLRIFNEAAGKRFLNLFAYTGTASVQAAAGGARKTVTVDASKKYLKWAQANFAVNGLATEWHDFVCADAIEWLEQHNERYDLIFCDPPTFSNSKGRRQDFVVQRDHANLIHSAMRCLEDAGVLYFSCNFRRFRMDDNILRLYDVEDITQESIPADFQRNRKVHVCFRIQQKPKRGWPQ